jgi:hypothetical protein
MVVAVCFPSRGRNYIGLDASVSKRKDHGVATAEQLTAIR